MTDTDVKSLLGRINQADLPYRAFSPAPLPEARPPPQAQAQLAGSSPGDFLEAYDPRRETDPHRRADVRLEDLFARLMAKSQQAY
jgi:hypothetical protein